MTKDELLADIRFRLQKLHEESFCSIAITDRTAVKYKDTDPEGSHTLKQIAKGQQQSHTLIDNALFDIEQMIND